MAIILPQGLPAVETLRSEGVPVVSQADACLHILVLNLMPTKVVTETQLARVLASGKPTVSMELLRTGTHQATHVSQEHMDTFYKTLEQVQHRQFDGLIITGAPVEHLEFEQVDYWQELCRVIHWSRTHVRSTLYICWGAQAGLYYNFGIPKAPLPEKLFGIYPHTADGVGAKLLLGMEAGFPVPHSRHTTIHRAEVEKVPQVKILASSHQAGVYAMESGRDVYLTGHIEYDPDTLEREYLRDKSQGLPIHVPVNYYPGDDPTQKPMFTWHESAKTLFANWLEHYAAPHK